VIANQGADGKSARDLTNSDIIKELLADPAKANTF
jgi:hypothetical protein